MFCFKLVENLSLIQKYFIFILICSLTKEARSRTPREGVLNCFTSVLVLEVAGFGHELPPQRADSGDSLSESLLCDF